MSDHTFHETTHVGLAMLDDQASEELVHWTYSTVRTTSYHVRLSVIGHCQWLPHGLGTLYHNTFRTHLSTFRISQFGLKKLETSLYRAVSIVFRYVEPFRRDSRV